MDFWQAALVRSGSMVSCIWYKRHRTSTISDVPGPENPSCMFGHLWQWQSEKVGVVEKEILEERGTVARWNGPLGEERLWIADPEAIHHILHSSSHLYEKPYIVKEQFMTPMDGGLAWADGKAHKQQGRAGTPTFGLVEAKALYPYFTQFSSSLAEKWHEIIPNGESGQTMIIDMHSWLGEATSDAIGAGAFDCDFGALENTNNEVTESRVNLLPSRERLFIAGAFKWTPKCFFAWVFGKGKRPVRFQQDRTHVNQVPAVPVEEKRQELEGETSTLSAKANSAFRPNWRLRDEEIIAQIRTIMLAGHNTAAKTLTFALWELAKQRHVQERLRAEIVETRARIVARGNSDFTVGDFDCMPYLLAVGKETLRLYPTANEVIRAPKKNDVLPLSKPVVGISGKVYKELHVPAGTPTFISMAGYNMNKDLWGPDAYEFRPERWLNASKQPETSFGVYGNLATFSGSTRSCVGWRFAVVEMYTLLVTLVRQFDFSLPDNGQEVTTLRSVSVIPVVVGEEDNGPQMPLKVTVLRNDRE